MDKDQFARAWGEIRARVKGRWNRLTDRDLDQVGGNAEMLIGMIQEKYDEPRKAIEMQLARLVEETQEATG
jgi:uncharacterized protein YjbJ (UPF0337 family)